MAMLNNTHMQSKEDSLKEITFQDLARFYNLQPMRLYPILMAGARISRLTFSHEITNPG